MNFEPAGPLRTSTNLGDPAGTTPAGQDAAGGGFDTIADLVAELVSAAEAVPRDRLAAARGRAGAGSLAEALRDEGVAQSEGIARSLARRHDLPFIDLQEERVSPDAGELIPLVTLQRVVAIPVSRQGDRLRVAVSDPGNIHGIDEIRLASRYPVEIGVASRDDILVEIEKISRRSEVLETFRQEGTRSESVHLLRGKDGPVLAYVGQVDDLEEARRVFAQSTFPIDIEHKAVLASCVEGRATTELLFECTLEP